MVYIAESLAQAAWAAVGFKDGSVSPEVAADFVLPGNIKSLGATDRDLERLEGAEPRRLMHAAYAWGYNAVATADLFPKHWDDWAERHVRKALVSRCLAELFLHNGRALESREWFHKALRHARTASGQKADMVERRCLQVLGLH